METVYTELELNAFEELLKYNENLTLEDIKCAYIKEADFLRITSNYEGKIINLNSIKNWIFLKKISIRINSIENLDGIEKLPHLENVIIHGVDNHKLKAIGECNDLKDLELMGDIIDISFIKNLKKLQDLSLKGNKNLTDISALADMKDLKILDLYNTGVADISVMKELKSLEEVILNDTNITDVSALSKLKNLHSISLANTKVKDISMLANLPKLESLNVYNTEVEDISAFIKNGKLKTIGIEGKKIPKPEKKNVVKEIAKLKEKLSKAGNKIKLKNTALESEISAFEEQYNIKFPENYKSFIMQIADGLVIYDDNGEEIICFNPLQECGFDKKGISKRFKYKEAWFWEEDESATDRKISNATSNGSICLADMGCGMEYHLIINGPGSGQVWMFTGEGVTPFNACCDFLDWVNAIIEGELE